MMRFQELAILNCCWTLCLVIYISKKILQQWFWCSGAIYFHVTYPKVLMLAHNYQAPKNTPDRVKQRIHVVDMHENDLVIICNTTIPSVANTPKKTISLQLFLMNPLQHIMMIRMMVLSFCSNSINTFTLTMKVS